MKDDWRHLMRYGYAPGNYMSTCHRCKRQVVFMDKRACTCRECAEAMDAEAEQLLAKGTQLPDAD